MKKGYLTKILGGFTVMFSLFLFFAAAKQLAYQNEQILANVTSGTNKKAPATVKPVEEVDDGVVAGSFNINSEGNVRYSYDKKEDIKFYYQAIKSEKLKNENITPVLKLEQTSDSGKKIWKETEWNWIDYNQGILYFHFQTEQDGVKKMEADFTGKYQIFFDN